MNKITTSGQTGEDNMQSPGVAFEKIVARIQQMMDPNAVVTHNEFLEDRTGNKRQFDVVIRGQFGGRSVLGVIECKDQRTKTGPDTIEAFAKKAENLGANLRIVVSRSGFTEQALNLAKYENVGCLSLLPDDPGQTGFSIGDMSYGVVRLWEELRLIVHFVENPAPLTSYKADSIKWVGKPVGKWFMKELFTIHNDVTKEGLFTFEVMFKEQRQLEIDGKFYAAKGITCSAQRICRNKRKWMSWSGDAFYDWHSNSISIPNKGVIVGSGVETDLSTWPDFAGIVPDPQKDPYNGFIRIIVYNTQKWREEDDKDVPDLKNL
jgi:hypothetical protein